MARFISIVRVFNDVRTAVALGTPTPSLRRQVYAQLGDLVFEVVGPVTGLESRREFRFARHDVIEGKPRLEAIGDELEALTFQLEFKPDITDPIIGYSNLCVAAAKKAALPLVFANGQVMGRYVITHVDDAIDRTDQKGGVLCRRTRVELVEFVESNPIEVQSRARREAATQEIASAPRVAATPPPIPANPLAAHVNTVTRPRP